MGLSLSSTAFKEGTAVPPKYTCDGADVSPPFSWDGAPAGTKSFALIAEDPDAPAGTWVHWVLFNIPGNAIKLAENISKMETLKKELSGAVQGKNDFHRIGYGGPCPPSGPAHRYFFQLYALDAPLALRAGVTKQELEAAMQGHVLMMAQLMGTYTRQRRQ